MTTDVGTRVCQAGIIPILRRMPEQQLIAVAEAVIAGGVEAIEVTLDSPGALEGIADLRQRYGERILIGAGTVMRVEQLQQALEAGAQFFLSPHLDPGLLQAARNADQLFIPGVLTPSEIVQADHAGATVLKLFPAGPLGTAYLRDLLGPFRGRAFLPTGGITPENAADFVHAGAVGVGMGSALVPRADVEQQDWAGISERVQRVVRSIQAAHAERGL